MTPITAEALARATCEVLEEAAFLFAAPSPSPPPADQPLVVARLPVFSDPTSWLVLAVPPSVAEEIAANLLGLDQGAPEASQSMNDAVGEILNIIGGTLLSQSSPAAALRLGTPEVALLGDRCRAPDCLASHGQALTTENGERIWTALEGTAESCI